MLLVPFTIHALLGLSFTEWKQPRGMELFVERSGWGAGKDILGEFFVWAFRQTAC